MPGGAGQTGQARRKVADHAYTSAFTAKQANEDCSHEHD
jgi:hypothetical protein